MSVAWDDPYALWDDPVATWDDAPAGAWARHATRTTRTPCWLVEIDLDYIDDGSVTATNPDGSLCYRTPATTDQGTLPVVTKTRRWMTTTTRPIPGLLAVPCLASVGLGAEEVRIGRGLGFFGQATIDLVDFVDDDAREEDPFATHASRTGMDLTAGSYLTKLYARNPYWTGRKIRIVEGWATDGRWWPGEEITHTYFVRDVQGPTDGKMRITAAGPLQLLNLSDQEAPKPSEGLLAANLNSSVTTATLHDATIAGDYPTSGKIRIGDEVMDFTRSGVTLTITRAREQTTAEEHSEGDTVQLCALYSAVPAVDIIEDLLTTYGGVDASLLDLTGWAAEQSAWLSLHNLTGVISAPTKVLEAVQEILEACGCILWWDDTTGKVRLKAVRPAVGTNATWTDKAALLNRPALKRDMQERVSRADVLLSLRSADLNPKEASSYKIRLVGAEQGAGATEHGSSKVKVIATRWLSADQLSLASRAAFLVVSQLKDGRQTYQVEVSAKDASLQIGDVAALSSRDLVGRTGAPEAVRSMVVKREAVTAGSRCRYTLERIPISGRFIYLCAAGTPDYDAASAAQRDPGWFLAPAGGGPFSNGDAPFVLG